MKWMARTIAAALAALLLSSPLSWAWLAQAPYPCTNALGDLYSLTFYWGIRAYKSSYALAAGQSMNIIRASDSRTCDLVYDGSGQLFNLVTASCSNAASDGQSPATFCNATTCKATKIYNQTGGTACASSTACDLAQSTDGNRFVLEFSCGLSPFCLKSTSTAQTMVTAQTYTPPSAVATLNAVGQRVSGTTFADFIRDIGNNNDIFASSSTASSWSGFVNGQTLIACSGGGCANNGAFHAAVLTLDGANTAFTVDSTTNTLNRAGGTTAATIKMDNGSSATVYYMEASYIASTGLGASDRAAIIANQKACWAF